MENVVLIPGTTHLLTRFTIIKRTMINTYGGWRSFRDGIRMAILFLSMQESMKMQVTGGSGEPATKYLLKNIRLRLEDLNVWT